MRRLPLAAHAGSRANTPIKVYMVKHLEDAVATQQFMRRRRRVMRPTKTINRRARLIDWLAPLAPVACTKQPHATRAAAWRHLHGLPARHDGERMNVYRCHLCRAWHVGAAGDRLDR